MYFAVTDLKPNQNFCMVNCLPMPGKILDHLGKSVGWAEANAPMSRIGILLQDLQERERRMHELTVSYNRLLNLNAEDLVERSRRSGLGGAELSQNAVQIGLSEYRAKLEHIRKYGDADMLLAARNWSVNRRPIELRLQQVDADIAACRNEIANLVNSILDCKIEMRSDIKLKLQLAAAVLVFNKHCDIDRYVYIVEECIAAI